MPNLMTMREKMARAYFKIGYSGFGPSGPPDDAWDKVDQDTRDAFLYAADVMLDALMEPTDAMSDAACAQIVATGLSTPTEVFQAMIRAAKEGK